MKKLALVLLGALTLVASSVNINAQTSTSPAYPVAGVDLSVLQSQDMLAQYALARVGMLRTDLQLNTQVMGWNRNSPNQKWYPLQANMPRTLNTLASTIGWDEWWVQTLTPTNNVVTLFANGYSTNDSYAIYNADNWYPQNPYLTIISKGGGAAISDGRGNWTLSSWEETAYITVADYVWISVPGVQSAQLIVNGYTYPVDVPVAMNGIMFPSAYAGVGTLVLSGDSSGFEKGGGYYQFAVNVADSQMVPITWLHAKIILQAAQQYVQFQDGATDLSMNLWTFIYQDVNGGITEYGTLPLGMVTYPTLTHNVKLSMTTSFQYARKFSITDLGSGKERFVDIPAGQKFVLVDMPVGSYYIRQVGMNVKPFTGKG